MSAESTTYDPLRAPDAASWLALGDDERILLVEDYHRRVRARGPNPLVHATLHVVVETQAAAGNELSVARTLARLQSEGLDRHDAIHAVASVLARHMHALLTDGAPSQEPNTAYADALERLDARGWLEEP